MSTFQRRALRVLTALLVIGFLAAGVPKLTSSPGWIRLFSHWGYPQWMLPAVGILEILGAATLVSRKTAPYGASLLAIIMFGAAYTHVTAHEGYAVVRPVLFLGFIGVTAWLRRSG
jgi:putative oxidoreductase